MSMEMNEIIKILKHQNYLMEKRYEILKSMVCDIYDEVISEKKVCPICKKEIRCYVPYGKPKMRYNAQCPECLGAERERLLARYLDLNWHHLVEEKLSTGKEKIRLLHIAPELGFYNRFQNIEEIEYYPVDFNPNYPYPIVKVVDITNIPYPDNYFDLIICFHVLQNVEDEKKALMEVKRVLNENGNAIFCDNVNTDFEKTLEKAEFNSPELRDKNYGNEQYVRRYGRDYMQRLMSVWGRNVEKYSVDMLEESEIEKYYLKRGEEICIYTK